MYFEKLDATEAPITLAEARVYMRSSETADDDMVTLLLTAATDLVEQWCDVAILQATYAAYYPEFPVSATLGTINDILPLPRPPIVSVDTVTYYDDDNTLQTLDVANYFTVTGTPAAIAVTTTISTYTRHDAICIEYTAGYDDSYVSVPEALRTAVGMTVAWLYDNPDTKELPFTVKALLEPYRTRHTYVT